MSYDVEAPDPRPGVETVTVELRCSACRGLGSIPGLTWGSGVRCAYCQGHGVVKTTITRVRCGTVATWWMIDGTNSCP